MRFLFVRMIGCVVSLFDFAAKIGYQSRAKFSQASTHSFQHQLILGRLILPFIAWLYSVLLLFKLVGEK